MTVAVWVVGARGQLGRAVSRAFAGSAGHDLLTADPLPWAAEQEEFEAAARSAAIALRERTDRGAEWLVAWCAGAAVTGSTEEQLERELGQLATVLRVLQEHGPAGRAAGSIFYASSAGGVYAGSAAPPFTEETVPSPLAPYGHAKLRAEALVTGFAEATGARALIGRIANIYGPAQSLQKAQGLISHLAKAQLTPNPASIYVPLETVRDYIYADDCAALIADAVQRLEGCASGTTVVKILASHQPVTIATLLGLLRAIAKARPNVMLGSSPVANYQAVDLRLRSVVWPDLDHRDLLPLPAGINNVMTALRTAMQEGAL
jgi:UDP-glucose 4-epimerase